jgi:hypothetical protein
MRLDRIEREEQILVSVIHCSTDPELNDTTLACRTVDVSKEGMQVRSELPIPVCSKLGLRLDLTFALYRLEAEVRWTRKEGLNYVGLRLDDDSADFDSWARMFAGESSRPQFADEFINA